jgi:PKD repeat protein
MKKFLIYIFPFCLVFVNSCKKNSLPPDDQNPSEPVFYFKCNVSGTPVSIQAGVNDYYMYSSHFQDANNIYVYKADLKKKTCTNGCGYSLSILINDFKESQLNEPMQPDSGLFLGNHQFNDGDLPPLGYRVFFSPLMDGTTNVYNWDYKDANGQHAFSGGNHFFKPGTYTVGLNVNSNGCTATHTNVFNVGSLLQTNVVAVKQYSTALYYKFSASPTMSNVVSYLWDFGDQTATTNSVSPLHYYSTAGEYIAKLRLIGASGDTCYSYYKVAAFPYETCHANYNNLFAAVPNEKAFSAITIILTDPITGATYSSSSLNQSTGNKFEIVSVSDYKTNESGDKTKMVKIKFNCTVKSGTDEINVTNGEAVIAVSYK